MTRSDRTVAGNYAWPTVLSIAILGCLAAEARALPDLSISQVDSSAVTGDWQTLIIAGQVAVTVENIGITNATSQFRVKVFEDANGNGTFEAGDTVLGETLISSLAAGVTTTVNVSVAGTVTFRNNLIHAFVDSDNQVAESDETNNHGNTGASCISDPLVGTLDTALEWSWTSSTVLPNSLNVLMTPSVMDVTDGNGGGPDGIPDVIFVSTDYQGPQPGHRGQLRVLRGTDGVEMYTVTDPALDLTHINSLAVGDLDGDGYPDIVGNGFPRNRVKAFVGATGTLMWESDPLSNDFWWGGVSIADLDGDGMPEVLAGPHAINGATGSIIWTGTPPPGGDPTNNWSISYAADIDLDGFPEVIFGNTIYHGQDNPGSWLGGDVKVQDASLSYRSMSAVGNFYGDDKAEIVFVSASQPGVGQIWLRNHDLTPIWGPINIPLPMGENSTTNTGGSPTIADFDGDGEPEIGVSGSHLYVVWDTDGTELWRTRIFDESSGFTGSSVFDFDCDGTAEVVYGDENSLWVFSGDDGAVQLQLPKASCTGTEYPLVADVDGDGHGEIIGIANNNCFGGTDRGLRVWGSAQNNWSGTRKVWNQHAYSITNVNDDGTIPANPQTNWLFPTGSPYNNFRQNTQTSCTLEQPDLTASHVRCNANAGTLTARIGNGGAANVAAGTPVSFYDGDPLNSAALLATTSTSVILAPGGWEDVSVTVALTPGTSTVFVVADDTGNLDGTNQVDGTVFECDETNNIGGGSDVCLGCVTPPADMVAWWPLDEDPTITNSIKEVVFGQNGIVVGSVAPLPNQYVGNSMLFSGTGHVRVPNFNRLGFGTGDLSIDAWIGPCIPDPPRGIATIDPIVDKRGLSPFGGIAGYRLYLFNGRLALTLADPYNPGQTDFISTGDPIPSCTWTHVAATVDRDMSVVLYVNGEVASQFIPTGKQGPLSNGANLLIGLGHPIAGSAATFSGAIDEVEIFSRALTQEEVRSIYNAGQGGKCKKSCSVSSSAMCCGSFAQMTVTLCNDSPNTCLMKWEPTGCNPTNDDSVNILPFSAYPPTGDPVYDPRLVAPGQCQSICVPLNCSSLGAGPFAWIYGMRTLIEDPDNPGEFIAICTDCGTLAVPAPAPCDPFIFCSLCAISFCGDFGILGLGVGAPFDFAITNSGAIDGNVDYAFEADPTDPNAQAVISLDGLPPGTPVTGSVFIPAGQTVPISVTASFNRHDPFIAHNVAILVDVDGDATPEPVASAGLRSLAPPPVLSCSDFNADGDVDLGDFAQFMLCVAGPGNPSAPNCPPSVDADCDDDGDVDSDDNAIIVQNFTGPLVVE